MNKLGFKEWSTLVVLIFIVIFISLLPKCISEYYLSKEYPLLENNIIEIESLIGDYSEYYVVIDKISNEVLHSISGTETPDGFITLVVPNNINDSRIVLDFYTCWDEKLASYTCNFEKNSVYSVKGKNIVLLKSDLQCVFIDISKDDLNRVKSSFREGNLKKQKAKVNVFTDVLTMEGELKPRGASTWNLYNKLPYSLKLANSKDLFGLGRDKKWNLLANASDKTLLKNEIFFDMARDLGLEYTPKIKNINLFFNDSYQGIYSITTKVSEGKNRINLEYGDFLINWGAPNYSTMIKYKCDFYVGDVSEDDKSPYVDVVYPDTDELTHGMKDFIQYKVQEYIDCLEGKSEDNLGDLVDLESFAKYYWIQEITMNADAWSRSYYMYYKKSDNKLHAGPLWDMEYTMGSGIDFNKLTFNNPEGWVIRLDGCYQQMFNHKEFVDEVNRVYNDYDIESLMYNIYDNFIKKSEGLSKEGELNYLMYIDENRYDGLILNDKSYKDYVKIKTDFYKERIDWISQEMK